VVFHLRSPKWLLKCLYLFGKFGCSEKIVPELIQSDLNNITVQEELKKILTPEGRQAQLEGYAEVRALLGDKGASAKAGSLMVDYLLK
jgi:lipid-A-disaccharide synthase